MNNIYKALIGLALVLALIGWALPVVDTVVDIIAGGVTNYDSLQLQPSSSSDNALDIRNSGGTSKFVIDGSGNVTLTGAFIPDSIGSGILTITSGGGGNTTSTATAANICGSTTANWLATGVATLTLPDAVPLQADCLDTVGAYRDFKVRNTGTATTSVTFSAGASSTIHTASSTGSSVVAGGNYIWLRFESVTTTLTDSDMVEISVFEAFR